MNIVFECTATKSDIIGDNSLQGFKTLVYHTFTTDKGAKIDKSIGLVDYEVHITCIKDF